jgi:hypothetical protein
MKVMAVAICETTPEHHSEEPRFTWSYESDDETISLEIATEHRHNSSCSCHPQWERQDHESYHTIPASEITASINVEEWIEEHGYPRDDFDTYDAKQTPYLQSLIQKIADAAEAKARAEEVKLQQKLQAAQRATELRERDEFLRLQRKFNS